MAIGRAPLRFAFLLAMAAWLPVAAARAADPPPAPADAPARTVEELARESRDAIVVIRYEGRGGSDTGMGTGFVVAADGLIATNLHVIGEARPIEVELADGRRFDVTAVHASDRSLDLALVRIDAQGLTALPLGDSDAAVDGQAVVAVGNPLGLARSVVAGVISGRREIDGLPLLQLAIPIEPGNSGGPLLDVHGRVLGLLTMKSLVTPNLGFAVEVNSLKSLLERPNPVPIERWLTIGALDPREWTPLGGARWRQRAGRMRVEGAGEGFGGRSMCLAADDVPQHPYEVAVTVKLDDESGAAGLCFCADGGDRHYGFYPSGGNLRFVRFDGPDVYSWNVLAEVASEHYRAGEWNHLKVRIEQRRIVCYVNDAVVVESDDDGLTAGRAGLVKFRDTRAEFRGFRVGRDLPAATPPAEVIGRVQALVEGLPRRGHADAGLVAELAGAGPGGPDVLRDRAARLEQEAAQLRRLAQAVHHHRVLAELEAALADDGQIDLLRAGLLIARLDNEELDVAAYLAEADRIAAEIAAGLPADADEPARLAALDRRLFDELGFHGSRSDYYNRANSYLNEVLDDREGLPITLSVLYIEVARRLGLAIEGVGLPGHFVVRHVPAAGDPQLIDVFERAARWTRDDAARKVQEMTGAPLREEHLAAVDARAILFRMLGNLLGVANRAGDAEGVLRYLDAMLVVRPDAAPQRWLRTMVRYQTGRRNEALADAQWLLAHEPADVDLAAVEEFVRAVEAED